jgi:hypothetical protein
VAAVAVGISFPAVFVLLSAAGAMQVETAFEVAKWSGLGLIGFYGFLRRPPLRHAPTEGAGPSRRSRGDRGLSDRPEGPDH